MYNISVYQEQPGRKFGGGGGGVINSNYLSAGGQARIMDAGYSYDNLIRQGSAESSHPSSGNVITNPIHSLGVKIETNRAALSVVIN